MSLTYIEYKEYTTGSLGHRRGLTYREVRGPYDRRTVHDITSETNVT